MKKIDKKERLLDLLSKKNHFQTAEELAKLLQSSEKTIYRLVKEINESSHNHSPLIQSERGKGFLLNSDYPIEDALVIEEEELSPSLRQSRLLERLLLIAPRGISLYDISQEFFVSESVILKDRQELQRQLSQYDLTITNKKRTLSILGEEINIRNAVSDLVPTFSMIDLDNLYDGNAEIDFQTAAFLQTELLRLEKSLKVSIPYPYNVNIFSHLYIMIERLKKSSINYQEISSKGPKKDEDNQLMIESQRVITHIEDFIGQKIHSQEVRYLYHYLTSSRLQIDSPENEIIHFSQRVREVTSFYLTEMGILKSEEILEQASVFQELASHISPLLRRLDHKIHIKNAMLDQIQESYEKTYADTLTVSGKVSEKFGLSEINSDEVGFLTLYFARFQEMSSKKIATAIMCTSGIGTSELLRSKIAKQFPELDIVAVLSYRDSAYLEENHPEVKLLITTVNLDLQSKIEKVLISAIITEEDLRQLRKTIQELAYGRN